MVVFVFISVNAREQSTIKNKNYFYVGNILVSCKFTALVADVAKLVDALDLGSNAARRGGSSPSIRTRFYLLVSVHLGF
jgi:hypothetical protein